MMDFTSYSSLPERIAVVMVLGTALALIGAGVIFGFGYGWL
jgi:hypothetical protein